MMSWTSDELDRIGTAEELEIATLRDDGTLRNPVTIWVVRVGDDLYVRSYRGRAGAWFRGVQARHEGRIWAGGVEKDVSFVEEADPTVNDQIHAAYRAKYRRYPQYVSPMLTPEVRATTLKLAPRATNSWTDTNSEPLQPRVPHPAEGVHWADALERRGPNQLVDQRPQRRLAGMVANQSRASRLARATEPSQCALGFGVRAWVCRSMAIRPNLGV